MSGDGSIVFDAKIDNSQMQKDLYKLRKKIENFERDISEMQQKREDAKNRSIFSAVELDKEKGKLQEIKDRLADIKLLAKDKSLAPSVRENYASSIPSVKSELDDQLVRVRAMTTEFNKIDSSVERYDKKIADATSKLNRAKTSAGELVQQLAKTGPVTQAMAEATEKVQKSAKKFSLRLKEVVRSALVFSLITKALSSLKDWLSKTVKANSDAALAIGKLKGSLLTLAQPIVNVVVPAFTAFLNILNKIVSAIANVVSSLFGTTLSKSEKAAEMLYKEADAIKSVGSAANEAAGSLAGFDEINTIQTTNSSSGSATGSLADKISPVFDQFTSDVYKKKLDEIAAYVSGSLLALGAILCFSGANIPLGIALMAAGAVGLVTLISLNWDSMNNELRSALTRMLLTLGAAALAIGAILCLSGANIPLGIALMVSGAALLASAVAINWNSIDESIKTELTTLLTIIGGFSLVIGAILCLTGASIPLGAGLMVVGAAALGTAVGINWDEMPEKIKSVLTDILVALGAALLAIGAILCFSGAKIPLGIGLIAAGALSLASAAGLNWEYIVLKIKENVTTILQILGTALLVIGILLTATGVAIPLGIALIVAGAASLVAAQALRWEKIPGKVKEFINGILLIAGTGLLAIGLILCLTGVGIPVGIAMILAGAAGLVTAAVINWDWVLEKFKEVWRDIKNWWNTSVSKFFSGDWWKNLGINIITNLLTGLKNAWKSISNWVSDKVSWITGKFSSATNDSKAKFSSGQSGGGRVSVQSIPKIAQTDIPRLAKGAVVPQNREFLAVLGDNKRETEVVSPLSTVKQAVLEALQEASGAGQPIEVKLYLDGRQIARNQIKHINAITQSSGKPVLLV